MAYEKSPARNSGRFNVRKLGLAIIVGCTLIILAYLVSLTEPVDDQEIILPYKVGSKWVAERIDKRELASSEIWENADDVHIKEAVKEVTGHVSSSIGNHDEGKDVGGRQDGRIQEPPHPQDKPICDLSNPRSDFCDMDGDVRMHGRSLSVVYVSDRHPPSSGTTEWLIKPYARKTVPNIKELSVMLSNGRAGARQCTVNHTVPAVVFANGGFTGNYFHDFTDVIVPLFATARQFNGEVQFLVTNIQGWWIGKYKPFLQHLSKYEIIDFDNDDVVRCFPRAVVGLIFHNELTIDPARAPNGVSMTDFTKFMRATYSLPRGSAINLRETPDRKPRLLIISRHGTRRFTNPEEISRMAEETGYEVVVTDSKFGASVSEFASKVNTFDVMLGVHGAGLTNFVFLPTGAVLIQIVPWGKLEDMCQYDFGFPATDAKLHYVQYSIAEEESNLIELYPRDHAVFTDPMAIHKLGWEEMGKIYLVKQNVKLDVNRFRPVLLNARELLHR